MQAKTEVIGLYFDLYRQIESQLLRANSSTYSKAELLMLQRQLHKEIIKLNKQIHIMTKRNIKHISSIACGIQLSFFGEICNNYNIDMEQTFEAMFLTLHTDVIEQIFAGGIYKDKAGLSDRIWADTKRFDEDIDYIIAKGLALNKDIYDIASDLVKYLNPAITQPIYVGVRGKAYYNAYRLAFTSISHAYQQAMKESSKRNPYVKKIKWLSTLDHLACKKCKRMHGKLYTPSRIPLDHPMGRCNWVYVIDGSLQDIASELRDWRKGGKNEKLDKWYKKYGKYYM